MYFQGASLKFFFTFFLNLFLLSTADARLVPVGLTFDSNVYRTPDGRTMYMNYSDCSNRWKRHYVWNQQRFTLKLKTASDRRNK